MLEPSFTPTQLRLLFLNPFDKRKVRPEVPDPFEGLPPFCKEESTSTYTHTTHTKKEVDSHGVKQVGPAMAPLEGLWKQDRQ